jgi:hypothetical protein
MLEHYTVTGALSNEWTIILDQPIPLPARNVRVTVVILTETQAQSPFLVKLEAIHQALRASGYQPRTKEQVDAQIRAERDSWGA